MSSCVDFSSDNQSSNDVEFLLRDLSTSIRNIRNINADSGSIASSFNSDGIHNSSGCGAIEAIDRALPSSLVDAIVSFLASQCRLQNVTDVGTSSTSIATSTSASVNTATAIPAATMTGNESAGEGDERLQVLKQVIHYSLLSSYIQ